MDIKISFFLIISVIFSFLSVFLGTLLFFIKSKNNKANLYLGLLVLSFSLFFLPGFFDALGILEETSLIIRLNFFSGVLVGPLIYLYCKSSIQKEALKIKNIIFHFIPFFISFLYFFPFLFKTADEKIKIYHNVIATGQVPESKIIIMAMVVHTMMYTTFSVKTVSNYLKNVKNTYSSLDMSFYKWLLFLSYSLLLPIFMAFLISATSTDVISVNSSLLSMAFIILTIHITFGLQPKFFHALPQQIITEINTDKEKYKNSNLQENQKNRYQNKLIECIERDKLYLNPELTISDFSDQIGIPTYYISQIINQELGYNFIDFINRYRIEEVKKKLKDDSQSHFTILTIAFDSGFNSKTAFYAAFKKNVGCTPSQYKKSF